MKTRVILMGPRPPPFLKKKPQRGRPSQPPMACQFLKSPATSRWAVGGDSEQGWSPQPQLLSVPSQAPIPETLFLPCPSPGDHPLLGQRGHFIITGTAAPHGPIPKDFILFQTIFQDLYSGNSKQRQHWLNPHKSWPCFKLTQSSDCH